MVDSLLVEPAAWWAFAASARLFESFDRYSPTFLSTSSRCFRFRSSSSLYMLTLIVKPYLFGHLQAHLVFDERDGTPSPDTTPRRPRFEDATFWAV
jgi:hypothetical protein